MIGKSVKSDESVLIKKALVEIQGLRSKLKSVEESLIEPIAIIGVGCRFPGGINNADEFWELLSAGVDTITEIPADRWDVDATYDPAPDAKSKSYIRYGAFVDDVNLFDANFFNIPHREAIQLDPQHRLLLEVSWESLENAGISPASIHGSETGVYMGLMNSDYAYRQMSRQETADVDPYFLTGNSNSFLAGRLSYTLGLNGPSMVVSTACSSSLVSVHLACQALRSQECDLALAGGVNLILDPLTNIMLSQMKAVAPDGKCKAFDATADGYGRGEGCGVIVLKRLSDALANRDNIISVIRGTAVNHSGKSAGLTVPNGLAQERLLRKALKAAQIQPEEVGYIEAHGTGTSLGDPIEIQALTNVLGDHRQDVLYVGSVKTNIGHLEAAAGIAGLIKTVLAIKHRSIPASLHYQVPNPNIAWNNIPLRVVTELIPWAEPTTGKSRIAGVSSFGLSGVNAHILLGEPPVIAPVPLMLDRPAHILCISADSESGLKAQVQLYRQYLSANPENVFADVCYSAAIGRTHFSHRLHVIASSAQTAVKNLTNAVGHFAKAQPKIAFLFTGQGAQYPDMARHLYQTQARFRQTIDHCGVILKEVQDISLLDILYSGEIDLQQTAYAQTALFCVEYALSELWQSWGVKPAVVMGHSLGEYVAAVVAGVFSLEDGLRIIAERGRLMQALPHGGKMLSAAISATDALRLIERLAIVEEVSLAATNTEMNVVFSGSANAIDRIVVELNSCNVICSLLDVSHAFHSHLMDPVLETFAAVVQRARRSQPKIHLISNVTGLPAGREITTPDYWCNHLRSTVRFAEGIKSAADLGVKVFVELGPKTTLLGLAKQCLTDEGYTWLPSLAKGKDWEQILKSLGKLYDLGVNVNWQEFDKDYHLSRQRVILPSYPFQRKPYWLLNNNNKNSVENKSGMVNTSEQKLEALSESAAKVRLSLAHQLLDIPKAEYLSTITHNVERMVAKLLGEDDGLDVSCPLIELPIDSLMAADLSVWCKREYGFEVSFTALLSTMTIAELGHNILDSLAILSKDQAIDSTGNNETTLNPVSNVSLDEANDKSFGLSYGQEALWFIHQSEPDSAAYNVSIALHIYSVLNVKALQDSFQQLVARHAALRTVFFAEDGEPRQLAKPSIELPFNVIDAKTWDQAQLHQHIQGEGGKVFDLTVAPLMRINLYQCGSSYHVLLLTFHHIICDNQSVWNLLGEVRDLYAANSRGTIINLPEISQHYRDYIAWQKSMLASQTGEKLREYWQTKLSGDLPTLNLPVDYARAPYQNVIGSSHVSVVSGQLTDRLRSVARKENVTINMLLLAAYQVLLHRYSGQADILVASPTGGQNQHMFHGVFGYFLNTVVLRADLTDDPAFCDFLIQVRQTSIEALEHQDYPFSLLVKQLRPKRDMSRSPLVQTRFSLQKAPPLYAGEQDMTQRVSWGDLVVEPYELAEEEGQLDINMQIIEGKQQLKVILKYDTNLFSADTIARMVEHYINLLDSIVEQPSARVSTLPILSKDERSKILFDWNATQTDADLSICAHQIFESQVSRVPNNIAVKDGRHEWTYEQLNQRANQLAHYLMAAGVGLESVVGIYLERSVDVAVAILGVMKAGGVYLPIDQNIPVKRLGFMLVDSNARLLLTQNTLCGRLAGESDFHKIPTFCLDSEWGHVGSANKHNPNISVPTSSPVYIIYTSGSTGEPKGVEILHRGLTNYLTWLTQEFHLMEGSGAPVISSIGFDLTVTSLFAPLMTGKTVSFLPEGNEIDTLNKLINEEVDFSLIKLTPTHLDMLNQLISTKPLVRAVRNIVIGGEALSAHLLAPWRDISPDTQLINHYGPTETTVGCCFNPIDMNAVELMQQNGNIPIGKPIANTQLYILDQHLEAIPIGVAGELYIGGAGVARGYINRPTLNQEKFISNPFCQGRLFRTGDLARYRADGSIEFLQRNDNQIKIRGYRIELNEIQCKLAEHPLVRRCVVIVREDRPGDKRLVAYFIPENITENLPVNQGAEYLLESESFTVNALRDFLAESLPAYLVPTHFVAMSEFPLIANGKVNRKALPCPPNIKQQHNATNPRDDIELELMSMWEEALGVDAVGIHDSFFDLGGHSLLAIKLMAKIQRKYGYDLPLGLLLENDTVAKLANYLRKSPSKNSWSSVVAFQTAGNKAPLFCIPGAGGNVIYFHKLAKCLGTDRPFYGLQAAGLDGKTKPHSKIEDMAAYYIDAIKRVQPTGPYNICGHSVGGWVAFEIAQQLHKSGEKAAFVGILDTPVPMATRENRSDWDSAKWIIELTMRIQHLLSADLIMSEDILRSLSYEQQLFYFRDHMTASNLFPAGVGVDQLNSVLQLFIAQSQIEYEPKNSVHCHLSLFRTEAAHNSYQNSESWGWDTLGQVDIYRVPGQHLTILADPYVQDLAQMMSACLDTVS